MKANQIEFFVTLILLALVAIAVFRVAGVLR
jgi:hypothetical protein